jgi:hypothetical protein
VTEVVKVAILQLLKHQSEVLFGAWDYQRDPGVSEAWIRDGGTSTVSSNTRSSFGWRCMKSPKSPFHLMML